MADEEDDLEEEEVQGPPPSKLVFVNHVDSYSGSSVAKVWNDMKINCRFADFTFQLFMALVCKTVIEFFFFLSRWSNFKQKMAAL